MSENVKDLSEVFVVVAEIILKGVLTCRMQTEIEEPFVTR